jgi:hypothetical protein
MTTIKPSEGLQYARHTVFVEGKIAGLKSRTGPRGDRWVVSIADLDSTTGRSDAILVLNENPAQNPPVHALGVKSPNQAILTLYRDKAFERLFQPGMIFRAEAIVGDYNGTAWFNVWQIILFEPQFMIGTRQLYNEPICERRLLLRARGIKGNRIYSRTNLGGTFIGNLVHSTFQEITTSPNRAHLIAEFRDNPKEFLLRAIQLDAILIGAMGQLGDTPRIYGSEWNTAKNQIEKLIDSQSVQNLLDEDPKWFSEVPVSGNSIHGDIDLRSPSRILELKTGVYHPAHHKQICVYLVGEMLEHGFSVKDRREAYLVSSSGKIPDDNDRVQPILGNSPQVLETLERFLLARHRLLLVSAGKKLPKIEFDPETCQDEHCEYYLPEHGSGTTSGCHFYCQTDRNWSCEGCKHSPQCTEHSKRHSFEVLDEANRVRNALNQEIEFHRKRSQKKASWGGQFEIMDTAINRSLLLRPSTGCAFDPPSPGEKIIIKHENHDYPTSGLMVGKDEDDNWMVIDRGTTPGETGSTVQLTQPRSELNGIYHLQRCIDELQRLEDVSHREGISFAGGTIVSGRPDITDNLQSIISDPSITDIFCQSFDVRISKQLLNEVVSSAKGRLLIVTDVKKLPIDGSMDLRGAQVLKIASDARSIPNALARVKDELEQHLHWVISPDVLLNTDTFSALPHRGHEFFDYIIIYETNSITGLEYFLMRRFGKHMVTLGDANCVGRPIHSQQSKLLGLGDNLMTRVYGRGFPKIETKMTPQIVCLKNQPIDPMLNQGLKSCRMISADHCNSEKTVEIEFIPCDSNIQDSQDQLVYSRELDISIDGPPKELRLMMDELIPVSEMENDLRELEVQINNLLFQDDILTPPTSGRRYIVRQAPINRDEEGTQWLVNFFARTGQLSTNAAEADKVIEKMREVMQGGVKPKNLAIMSASPNQLAMLDKRYGTELEGIDLRTPYGVRGESWGHIIVSCATKSAQEIDTREFYTMIRASRTRVYIIGASSVLEHHPLLRKMQQ